MCAQVGGRRTLQKLGQLITNSLTSGHTMACASLPSGNSIDGDDYRAKHILTTGKTLPDPYGLIASEWSLDLKHWPPLEFPQIHLYLINTPSIYTHQNKAAYKSLDAYNYVVCGHVQRIKYHNINLDSAYCFLMAEVLPSQRQGLKAQFYKAWVCLHKKDAHVLTAHCTCMAGAGSVCSHAAAVLIKIEMAVRNGLTQPVACTSKASKWNDMSRKKVDPAPLSEIIFNRPKQKTRSASKNDNKKSSINPENKDTSKERNIDIEEIPLNAILELKEIFPKAAVLTSCDDTSWDTTDTDTASESGEILPQPMTALFDPVADKLTKIDLDEKCSRIFGNLTKIYKHEQLEMLETVTKEQAASEAWHVHRKGRITASNLHQVYRASDINSTLRIVEKLMGYTDSFDNEALKWGRTHEEIARNVYLHFMRDKHDTFKLHESGLVVPHSKPFIGASPDGKISCLCCGRGIVEIKCPFKYRDKLINFESDTSFCLSGDNVLKHSHPYFYQVQLQMYVCEVAYCDFVIWTKQDLLIHRLMKDESFLERILAKAESFFIEHLLPEIVTRKNDLSKVQNVTCQTCVKPKFGKVIYCTRTECQKMYHYNCVGIKRSKKGWLCPSCK